MLGPCRSCSRGSEIWHRAASSALILAFVCLGKRDARRAHVGKIEVANPSFLGGELALAVEPEISTGRLLCTAELMIDAHASPCWTLKRTSIELIKLFLTVFGLAHVCRRPVSLCVCEARQVDVAKGRSNEGTVKRKEREMRCIQGQLPSLLISSPDPAHPVRASPLSRCAAHDKVRHRVRPDRPYHPADSDRPVGT